MRFEPLSLFGHPKFMKNQLNPIILVLWDSMFSIICVFWAPHFLMNFWLDFRSAKFWKNPASWSQKSIPVSYGLDFSDFSPSRIVGGGRGRRILRISGLDIVSIV